jgi:hypothetical protein
MKQLFFLAVLSSILLISCNHRNRSDEIKSYQYKDNSALQSGELEKKVGAWVKEGVDCYGILMMNDPNGVPQKLKEVKAKVVSVFNGGIKMKAMESVDMAPVDGCSKIGIRSGETWIETEGDLFKTREEAIAYIKTNFPGLRAE